MQEKREERNPHQRDNSHVRDGSINFFKVKETSLHIKGLTIARNQGEGIIISDFGQVFLITFNDDIATIGFQSPTDFNHVELHSLKIDVAYEVGKQRYMKAFRQYDGDPIVLKMDFPREMKILKQESTSIRQNLIRPI